MKIKTGEFIAISACTMMLTALGIDIMLPVFGEIRKHFGLSSSSTATANIVVFFFLGQVTQIIFGILSDRFGRLTIQRIGFPLYIIGGIAATYAPNLGFMIVARFIAGMGASAVLTTTIAGVRDRFSGDEMAKILSLIFTIFLSTPVFAPFLGIAILSVAENIRGHSVVRDVKRIGNGISNTGKAWKEALENMKATMLRGLEALRTGKIKY